MIVVDTNVIAYFYLEYKDMTETARMLNKANPDWIAPYLWQSEFMNVLNRYIRCGKMTLDSAKFNYALANNMITSYTIVPSNVLDLATQSKCTAYDCEFVSLAQACKSPLITEDKQILAEFPDTAVSINNYLTKAGCAS